MHWKPDLNANDLGFSTPSWSDQWQGAGGGRHREIRRLSLVGTRTSLAEPFCSLWKVMRCKGDNSYKIPHLGKEKLARAGNLPKTAQVDDGNYSARMAVLE
ncbi:unnamed protein product, partial [Discosporangium mesarthrocarpum]